MTKFSKITSIKIGIVVTNRPRQNSRTDMAEGADSLSAIRRYCNERCCKKSYCGNHTAV